MTPAEKEAEKVSIAYQQALILLGDAMLKEVLAAYKAVSIANAASFATFSAKATALIYRYRKQARDIAVAETQLTRALLTGSTYSDWSEPFEGQPTIGELRLKLYSQLEAVGVKRPARARAIPPTTRATVDLIPEIEFEERREAKTLDKEIEDTLRILGEESLEGALKKITKKTGVERDRLEAKTLETTSSNLAMGTERIALNGARHYDSKVLAFDPKIQGWIRSHLPGAPDMPCGWCSMLMSRGAVYASQKSATSGPSDDGRYHSGCHCVAVKVYTRAQYNSERFALNREYQSLWPQVTKGLHGDAAVSAWRKYIRKRNEAERPTKLRPAEDALAA